MVVSDRLVQATVGGVILADGRPLVGEYDFEGHWWERTGVARFHCPAGAGWTAHGEAERVRGVLSARRRA